MTSKNYVLSFLFILTLYTLRAQNPQWGQPLTINKAYFSFDLQDNQPYLLGTSITTAAYKVNSLNEIEETSLKSTTNHPQVRALKFGDVTNVYYNEKETFKIFKPKILRLGWLSVSNVNINGGFADRSDGLSSAEYSSIHTSSGFAMPEKVGAWKTNYKCEVMYNVVCFYSPDGSKQLFTYLKSTDKGDIDTYGLELYDSSGNKISSVDVVMPMSLDKIKLHGFGVTDEGTVFCIYKRYDIKRGDKAMAEYRVIVGNIDMSTGNIKEIEVETEGRWLKSICVNVIGNELTINGMYVDKEAGAGANFDGVFYAQVNLGSLKSTSGSTVFSEGTIFTWEPRVNNPTSYFRIRKIILEEDGVCYLLSCDYGFSGSGVETERYGRGLVFIKTDYKGKVILSHKINRNFRDKGDQIRIDTHIAKHNSSYYIFYNAPKEQVDYPITAKTNSIDITQIGAVLLCTKISDDNASQVLIPQVTKLMVPYISGFRVDNTGTVYMAVDQEKDMMPKKIKLGTYELQ